MFICCTFLLCGLAATFSLLWLAPFCRVVRYATPSFGGSTVYFGLRDRTSIWLYSCIAIEAGLSGPLSPATLGHFRSTRRTATETNGRRLQTEPREKGFCKLLKIARKICEPKHTCRSRSPWSNNKAQLRVRLHMLLATLATSAASATSATNVHSTWENVAKRWLHISSCLNTL